MTIAILFRLAAPALALCFAVPALADAKSSGGSNATADCYAKAQLQYVLAIGACSNDPYRYQMCLSQAELDHALALTACARGTSAVISGGTRKSVASGGLELAPQSLSESLPGGSGREGAQGRRGRQ